MHPLTLSLALLDKNWCNIALIIFYQKYLDQLTMWHIHEINVCQLDKFLYLFHNGGPFFRRQRVSDFMKISTDFRLVKLATKGWKLNLLPPFISLIHKKVQFVSIQYICVLDTYIIGWKFLMACFKKLGSLLSVIKDQKFNNI